MPTTIPDAEQAQIQALQSFLKTGPLELVNQEGTRMALPNSVIASMQDVVTGLKEGRTISLLPDGQTITTQTAANILHVSRPYLVQLLRYGQIPFYRIGTHRRILLSDLLAYKEKRDAERHAILNQMTEDAVRDGMYDIDYGIPEGGSDE